MTRIGPGTACGDLMRRYWQPVAASVQLDVNPVQKLRILGEDLVLYRDRQGKVGLVGPRCPHRAVDLQFGIPEDEGLRCPYHGWMFDGTGRCIEQPLEPPDSTRRCCRSGTCSRDLMGSARLLRTGCHATGCRWWKIVATTCMPSTRMGGSFSTCWSARAG
ncbi:MAG: Rieske 2Fe-2S domain-containing protein [Chloroflexi bacterium]|nr:Rieske 2Fe-2S domain-containing protein [Chloroflexota bacterium]